MNYEDLENDILERLQPITGADIDVIALPEKEANNKLQFAKPRVTVAFVGNELRDTALPDQESVFKSFGSQVQTKTLLWDISIESRSLRGGAGVYKILGAVEILLAGFKPTNCDKLYQMSCICSSYDKGTWTYTYRWACKTLLIEQVADETGVPLTAVYFKEVIGSWPGTPEASVPPYPSDGQVSFFPATTDDLPEGVNPNHFYFTVARARSAFSGIQHINVNNSTGQIGIESGFAIPSTSEIDTWNSLSGSVSEISGDLNSLTTEVNEISAQVDTNTNQIGILETEVNDLESRTGVLETEVVPHITDYNNPHNTTLEQVRSENNTIAGDIDFNGNKAVNVANATADGDAVNKSQLDTTRVTLENQLAAHTTNEDNPHNTSLAQVMEVDNSMSQTLDANNNRIINLPDATSGSEPVTKNQFDTYVQSAGGYREDIDCSTNPNYPAAKVGWRFEVTVAGKIGGAGGIDVGLYDEIVCKHDNAGGDQATVGVYFYAVQGNIDRATETTAGYIAIATDAEVQAGADNTKAVTSSKLWNWWNVIKNAAITFAGKITFSVAPRFNTLTGNQILLTDSSNDLVGQNPNTAFNKNFGNLSGNIPAIASTLFSNGIVETDGAGNLITEAKGTAFNASFGNAPGQVPVIGSTTSPNQRIETNGSNVLVSVAKGTADNKDFGTGVANIPAIGTTLGVNQTVETDGAGKIITAVKKTGYNSDFGTGPTNIPQIASTLNASQRVETDPTGKLVSVAKATADNKDFGTGSTNVPQISSNLGVSQTVETDGTGKLITAAKQSGYNLAVGVTPGTLADGGDARLSDTRYPKTLGFGVVTVTAPASNTNENCVAFITVPAGLMAATDEIFLPWYLTRTTTSNVTINARISTILPVVGSIYTSGNVIGTFVSTPAGTKVNGFFRWVQKNSLSVQQGIANMFYGTSSNADLIGAVNTSGLHYIAITIVKQVGTETVSLENFRVIRYS